MTRFKTRVDGFMKRKPHWICRNCGVTHTVRKPGKCSACENNTFIYFASKKEFTRYHELLILERAEEIVELELQPTYKLVLGIDTYKVTFDFRYIDKNRCEIIEDVKTSGTNTDLSKIKRSLAQVQHGITVTLV